MQECSPPSAAATPYEGPFKMNASSNLLRKPLLNVFTWEFSILSILLLIGLTLRLAALAKQSLWIDEIYSLELASADVKAIITGKLGDHHTPPFYYLLLHYWLSFGSSEFSLRLLSVLFGVASIFVSFILGKRLFDTRVALVTTSLLAFSPFHIYYAQEARMYTLMTFLALISTYCLVLLLPRDKWSSWLGFISISVMGIYTHYYMVFLLIAQNIYVIWLYRNNASMQKKWLASQLLIMIVYLPWLTVIFELAASGGQSFRAHLLPILPYAFFRMSVGYSVLPINHELKQNIFNAVKEHSFILIFVFSLFFTLIANGIKVLFKMQQYFFLFSCIILCSVFLPLLISIKVPMFSDRYLIIISPFIYILISLGLTRIKPTVLSIFCAISISIIFSYSLYNYYFSDSYGKEQWRESAKYIESNISQRDILLFDASFTQLSFDYYYKGKHPRYGLKNYTHEEYSKVLTLTKCYEQIWLILSHHISPYWREVLSESYQLVNLRIFPLETGIFIYQYSNVPTSIGCAVQTRERTG
jgi:mannosyltransferase